MLQLYIQGGRPQTGLFLESWVLHFFHDLLSLSNQGDYYVQNEYFIVGTKWKKICWNSDWTLTCLLSFERPRVLLQLYLSEKSNKHYEMIKLIWKSLEKKTLWGRKLCSSRSSSWDELALHNAQSNCLALKLGGMNPPAATQSSGLATAAATASPSPPLEKRNRLNWEGWMARAW